ncbi:MAG: hypothetical protein NC212_10915 [Staphylococcus sp.]|nr:hypothetical protein [Staphylococcus sp.]
MVANIGMSFYPRSGGHIFAINIIVHMAVKLLTPIKPLMFTSAFLELVFEADRTETRFVLLNSSGIVVLDTVYYPALNGNVTVYGLNRLLDDAIGDDICGDFTIKIDSVAVATFKAFRCSVAMESSADDFLTSSFMTAVSAERDTAVGRHECLSVYNPESLPMNVLASYVSYSGSIETKTFSLSAADSSNGVYCYDVSPIKFNDFTIGELVALTVSCGARRQRYRVLMDPPQHDPAIIFRNMFGCWETIFLCGVKETDVAFTRSAAMINGRFLNYDLDEVITYKASTGPMRYGSDRLARDLARSKAVYILRHDGTPGDRLTITDCDVKTDNADDTIQSFSFTYRKASLISTDFQSPAPYRIFDNTFDLSYE